MPHALQTFRTIAVTATVTSAAWVVAGALWLNGAKAPPDRQGRYTLLATPPQNLLPPAAAPVAPTPALTMPVVGIRAGALVDTFTQARQGGARIHDAIDIVAPRGTPVVAAAPGRVEKLFLSKPGGITVYVRSPDRTLIYYYAHLDGYAPGLAEGQNLSAGAPLGFVGSTGNADPAAPHLHFAILRTTPQARWWEPSVAINPYPLLVHR